MGVDEIFPESGTGGRASLRSARPRRRRGLKVLGAVVALVVIGVLGVVGVLATKGELATSKVFKNGSILDLIGSGSPPAADKQGRTNILVFGTSQDDPNHGGQWLADSIQLVSVDERTKKAVMIAIPRDTWVHLPTPCVIGTEAKVNAVYECASGLLSTNSPHPSSYAKADAAGGDALARTVGDITGLTVQYWVHVDYTVVRQSVDAVGGIDVNIVGDGHSGIYDSNMGAPPGCTTPECSYVYYRTDGVYHLDGAHALYLARARGDANPRSYLDFGLARGDFDREANQQKIIVALKDKATSAGTLANPVAVFNLLGALGDNVTTNLTAGEARSLIGVARAMAAGAMQPLSLTLGNPPVLTTGTASGQSIVLPTAGMFDWSQVRAFIAKNVPGNT